MRKPFVVGNWKMNMDGESSVSLAEAIAAQTMGLAGEAVDVALCPPFVYLGSVFEAVSNSRISVGAQNVYFEQNGAFTGEVSVEMLKDVGCTYVLCGHSERRHILGETDDLVNKKVAAAISGGLLPVMCVGELLEQREAGMTIQVVRRQVEKGLGDLGEEKVSAVTLAYEPVWAIGTGRTATPEQAQEVHAIIRDLITELFDSGVGQEMRILYGGSVKPTNAGLLMGQKDVDGLLVGGASLKAEDFIEIIKAAA